ncbi:heavy metal translocating P-type ATPase, partial [Candidatus Woesearchaeota archaeon]|nr:heavy metal translocating P-type ATPase [Candidatus Woesearchaeota archaeon]
MMRLLEEQATGEKIVREKMVTYICPMHPAVQREKEGICPQCGMNLIPQKEHKQTTKATAVHDQHKRHSPEIFLRRFVVVFLLTIPILLYSELADIVLKWTPPQFEGVEYVLFILGSIIFFYGGNVFILGAYRELRAKLPGMMTLIALAITAAYIFSVYAVIAQVAGLFWELATLIAVMLFGHWLEMKAVGGAHGALQELAKLLPDTAEVIRGKTTTIIPLEELREGDSVLVKPGAKIP